ncbi:hypothetical protein GCM10007904_23440 [Oharaeibacter diazotrophicus]|nr:hypothetical protein GCM10007904_23440 [Oharaeibacter diazotrophicus]
MTSASAGAAIGSATAAAISRRFQSNGFMVERPLGSDFPAAARPVVRSARGPFRTAGSCRPRLMKLTLSDGSSLSSFLSQRFFHPERKILLAGPGFREWSGRRRRRCACAASMPAGRAARGRAFFIFDVDSGARPAKLASAR